MYPADLIIGTYLSDDFWFFFTEESLKKLIKEKKIEGPLWFSLSSESNLASRMKLIVNLFDPRQVHQDTDLSIEFDDNQVSLMMSMEDFKEWFMSPDSNSQKGIAGFRSSYGDANVYMKREADKDSLSFKSHLIDFITKAEVTQA